MRYIKKLYGQVIITIIAVVTALALVIGLIVINILKPGVGMNVDPSTLDVKSAEAYLSKSTAGNWQYFLLHIIPDSIVNAVATNNLLQVLFFSVLLKFALTEISKKAKPLLSGIKYFECALFKIIGIIMKVAAIGGLGAMGFTIGKYGLNSLASLNQLMLSFYITCILCIVLILGGILKFYSFNIFHVLRYICGELLVFPATSSAEAAFPSLMNKLEKMECSESIVGLVVPTHYSF